MLVHYLGALLAYSPSNKPSVHQRLFSGLDNIYCVFLGGLHNLSMLNKQYGVSKGTNVAMFIIEAYRTLRDRVLYPADEVLKELEGSFGFVIYDNKDETIFVASVQVDESYVHAIQDEVMEVEHLLAEPRNDHASLDDILHFNEDLNLV